MFTLCIPTMNRFDNFLVRYLPDYLENEYIDEIVITDETGDDIEKIKQYFPNNEKLVLVKNDKVLGPFLNKHKACLIAKNEWIALIDSDNFADKNYFMVAKNYINDHINDNNQNVILSPSKGAPIFDFSHISGTIFKEGNFEENRQKEQLVMKPNNISSETLFNLGNYIINKWLINNLDIDSEIINIQKSSACDVMYFNVLLFEKLNLQFHVVPNLEYKHVVHDESIFILTRYNHEDVMNNVKERFYSIK